MRTQRLRLRLSISAEAATLSHREVAAALEVAAKAAGLPLVYSEGKRPTPQISIAAPLSLGSTSDCELVDLYLSDRAAVAEIPARFSDSLPDGIRVLSAEEVGVSGPSLQSLIRWSEYEVEIPRATLTRDEVQAALDRILQADALPSEYRRENKVRIYDLRPLILDLRFEQESADQFVIGMRLSAKQDRTARVDQVVMALGLPAAQRIHRSRLYLTEVPPAVVAYRHIGDQDEG